MIMKNLCVFVALIGMALAQTNAMDKMALEMLFETTGGIDNGMYMMMGGHWTNGKTGPGNWTYGDPCNDGWFGVTCAVINTEDRVIEVELENNYLYGYIPTEISYLTELTILNLANNDLIQNLPSEMSMLSKLQELHLNNNRITGAIPYRLDNMTALTILDLSHNQMGGLLPAPMVNMDTLETLHLQNNSFDGLIPSFIQDNFTSLTALTLNDNEWICPIPEGLESAFPAANPNCGCGGGQYTTTTDAACQDCPEDTFNANWQPSGDPCNECTGTSTAEPGSRQCKLNLNFEDPPAQWVLPTVVLSGSILVTGGLLFFAYKQINSPELRTKKKKKIPSEPKSEAGTGEKEEA